VTGFLDALRTILSPGLLPFLVGGAIFGIVPGAIPGVTEAMGIALLLPLAFRVNARFPILLAPANQGV
jgi:TctA family transporter